MSLEEVLSPLCRFGVKVDIKSRPNPSLYPFLAQIVEIAPVVNPILPMRLIIPITRAAHVYLINPETGKELVELVAKTDTNGNLYIYTKPTMSIGSVFSLVSEPFYASFSPKYIEGYMQMYLQHPLTSWLVSITGLEPTEENLKLLLENLPSQVREPLINIEPIMRELFFVPLLERGARIGLCLPHEKLVPNPVTREYPSITTSTATVEFYASSRIREQIEDLLRSFLEKLRNSKGTFRYKIFAPESDIAFIGLDTDETSSCIKLTFTYPNEEEESTEPLVEAFMLVFPESIRKFAKNVAVRAAQLAGAPADKIISFSQKVKDMVLEATRIPEELRKRYFKTGDYVLYMLFQETLR